MAGAGTGVTTTVKAVAIIAGDPNVRGFIQFIQQPNGSTHVAGKITGLSPGFHGFHIHALGDTTNGCTSTGPHFNPLQKSHGSPWDHERHAGDLGNILANEDGVAQISIEDSQIPLGGPHSILGRAVVVHADPDDLGKGGHELSKTTGNAGARVGCGNPGCSSSSPGIVICTSSFNRTVHVCIKIKIFSAFMQASLVFNHLCKAGGILFPEGRRTRLKEAVFQVSTAKFMGIFMDMCLYDLMLTLDTD